MTLENTKPAPAVPSTTLDNRGPTPPPQPSPTPGSRGEGAGIEAERDLFLPPRRMLRYQLAKLVLTLIVVTIFTGWLIIQWSNPMMRFVAAALLMMTLWGTFRSIVIDLVRSRGRQLAIRDGQLLVTRPDGSITVPMSHIFSAVWREDTSATMGLWLYDEKQNVLARLDDDFLADQSEARSFLNWARQRTELNFDVTWPAP